MKLQSGVEKIRKFSSLIRVSLSLSTLLIFLKALETVHKLWIALCQQQGLAEGSVLFPWNLPRCFGPPGTAVSHLPPLFLALAAPLLLLGSSACLLLMLELAARSVAAIRNLREQLCTAAAFESQCS